VRLGHRPAPQYGSAASIGRWTNVLFGAGYDACHAKHSMEWCIRDSSQVQVIRISKVSLVGKPPAKPCPQGGATRIRNMTSAADIGKQAAKVVRAYQCIGQATADSSTFLVLVLA
jgi:hypothetical protein